jgi:hypothetical protein
MSDRIWAEVTVHGKRARDFERVYGSTTVRVKELLPVPTMALLPGFDKPQPVYMLDLEWAKREGHRARLVAFISERFGIPADDVERELDERGVPILARDCTYTSNSREFL